LRACRLIQRGHDLGGGDALSLEVEGGLDVLKTDADDLGRWRGAEAPEASAAPR